MILIDEPGYRIIWTAPIPLKDGVELTKEELLEHFNKLHSIKEMPE